MTRPAAIRLPPGSLGVEVCIDCRAREALLLVSWAIFAGLEKREDGPAWADAFGPNLSGVLKTSAELDKRDFVNVGERVGRLPTDEERLDLDDGEEDCLLGPAAEARTDETGECVLTGIVDAGESIEIGGKVGRSKTSSPSSSFRLKLVRPGLILGAGRKIELLACRSASLRPAERGVGGGNRRMRTSPVMPDGGGELRMVAAWLLTSCPGMWKASRSGW